MNKYKFVLLFLIIFSQHSFAYQQKVILVTEQLPPYQIVNKDTGEITGFATEIVLETLKRAKLDYYLKAYPWVRTYNLALKKPNHCVYSTARLPSREYLFTWIGPVTENSNAVIWSLKSNEHSDHIKSIEDLKQHITAVNKNDATHTGMLNLGLTENKNLYVVQHTQSLVKLLFERPEIDFIVADDITIPHRAKVAGVPVELLHRVIEVENLSLNFHLACNKNSDKEVISKLTNSLASIHKDGSYQKILKKWIKEMPYLTQ